MPGKLGEMTSRIYRRSLLPLVLLSGVAMAQKYEPLPPPLTVDPCATHPNPKIPTDPNAKPPVCPPPSPATAAPTPSTPDPFPFPGTSAPAENPPAAKPSTADQFPFPGSETPATPAPSATPDAPPTPAKKGSTADQFPYPGETSKSPDAVPEGDTPRYVPDSPAPSGTTPAPKSDAADDSSSSSSSSSSTLPTAADDAKPDDTANTVRPKKGRRALPKVSALSQDERVTEDLNVAKFYSSRGNYEAAYLRSKDAITVMPDDAESHFRVAQAAQKLKKNDEAITEYNLYLKLDPGGDWSEEAEEALLDLQKGQ
ncbi:MAG: hypothetical protein ABI357_09390 [Granulicella sp.]